MCLQNVRGVLISDVCFFMNADCYFRLYICPTENAETYFRKYFNIFNITIVCTVLADRFFR